MNTHQGNTLFDKSHLLRFRDGSVKSTIAASFGLTLEPLPATASFLGPDPPEPAAASFLWPADAGGASFRPPEAAPVLAVSFPPDEKSIAVRPAFASSRRRASWSCGSGLRVEGCDASLGEFLN